MSAVRNLYVHVPFCAHRCGYCDFVTTSAKPELHERYVAALARELELRRDELGDSPPRFDTIFIGGGTPTLLQPRALEQLLTWLQSLALPDAEITIECNPETVTEQLVQQLVDGGVTRVSLGAQSFAPHVLTTLERRADGDTVRQAFRMLQQGGISRLSTDIIWGVPGQSDEDVADDLAQIIELGPEHISAYELEFKPGTRLTRAFGDADTAVGEASDEMYDAVVDTLNGAGYHWYETANFAQSPDAQCRHNLATWNGESYIGVGVGAIGTIGTTRRANLGNVPRWLASVEGGEAPPARIEQLTANQRRIEQLMLSLRLARPTRITAADIGDNLVDALALEQIADMDLADVRVLPTADVDLTLTRRGRMLLNGVTSKLLAFD